MSYCQQLGKDEVIVVTKEDHQKPVSGKVAALSAALENDDEDEPGFILPNGELNWNCPCVGGMVAGPCGYEFRQAFSCFHKSQPPDRGAECADNFRVMHECMAKYPTVYGSFGGDTPRDDDDDFEEDEERHRQSADVSVVVDEKKDKK